ncbi:hypothetical protein IKZ40_09545 [bacterium]|nr:hypothetical protein [bacterium]
MSFRAIGDRPPNYRPVKAGMIRTPAALCVIADAACIPVNGGGQPAATAFLYNPTSGDGGYADFRHGGSCSAGFADGHAASQSEIAERPADGGGWRDRLGYLSRDDRAYDPEFEE